MTCFAMQDRDVLRRVHGRRLVIRSMLVALGATMICMPAGVAAATGAEDYPARPMRILVGVSPGGPTDIYSRMIGQKLTERWGQPMIVDNRAGAGQTIAADITARAAPDGYTLFMCTQTFAVNPSLYRKLPYDSLRDFAPVSLVVRQPLALFVSPTLPVRSLKELVAYGRANPGKLNYGSSGPSSSLRFAAELLKVLGGFDLVHVAYKGTAPALTDLATGQVQIVFSGLPAAQPFYSSGRIRPIAVAGEQRLEGMPDLPTAAEAGLPGLVAESWFGVLAPAKTPPAIVRKLSAAIMEATRTPEMRARLSKEGAHAVGNTPEEFGALIRSEMAKWGKIVRDNDIRAD
jgi:tripartite-type tricarboxylate transporter receptor subunit TctC